jgi:hypothetical protein
LTNRHPHLLFDEAHIATLQARAAHPQLRQSAERLKERVEWMLQQSPLTTEEPNGVRWHQGRVWCYCMAYTLWRDERYLQAAVAALDVTSARPQWNTSHFADLRTGEVSMTYAIAYDWLYHDLNEAQRQRIVEAAERLGLQAYLDSTKLDPPPSHLKCTGNWNSVTNGSAAVLALALQGESALSEAVLAEAVPNLEYYWNDLAPDGGFHEGLSYWRYGMRYGMLVAEVLRRCGYAEGEAVFVREGVKNTGYFPIVFQPGQELEMSFSDSSNRTANPIHYLLGRESSNPDFIWFEDHQPLPPIEQEGWPQEVLRLLWRPLDEDWLPEAQTNFSFQIAPVYSFPSIGWAMLADQQPNPHFCLAFKSGSLAASHTHLDLNHITVAVGDAKLLLDLGRRTYTSDYFGPGRYKYYELDTRGHNTLLIGGAGQVAGREGELIGPLCGEHYEAFIGVADGAYHCETIRVRRHVVFVRRRYWVLLDEIITPQPQTVELRFHTYGEIAASTPAGWTVSGEGQSLQILPLSEALHATIEHPNEWIVPVKVLSLHTRQAACEWVLPTVLYPNADDVGDIQTTFHHQENKLQITVGSDQIAFEKQGAQWALVGSSR